MMEHSSHTGGTNQRPPWRVRYRVGLGATVSLLLAITLGAPAAATYVNTRAAIVELAHDRAHDLLIQTGARVKVHMMAAVPSVELSRMLIRDKLLQSDRTPSAASSSSFYARTPRFRG